MIGIGTDLVDVGRFREVLERTPTIVERLFTDGERKYAELRADPAERLAVRFAAKEAVLKAMGLGLGSVELREIEVVRAESGQPSLVLHGSAEQAASERGVGRWLLTLSHSDHVASATAVALGSTQPELAHLRRRVAAAGTRARAPETPGAVPGGEGAEGVHLVTSADVAAWLPRRPSEAHKWQTALCLVAGSPGMSGAAALAAGGAQRAGAGYVRLCTPGGLASGVPMEVVQVELPSEGWAQAVLEDLDRFSALVVGNGLGTGVDTESEVRRLVAGAGGMPTVVDADGITALGVDASQVIGSRSPGGEPSVVLTPHDGEFARLAGSPPGDDRVASARQLASRLGAVVLLKGSTTTVAHPDGRVLLSSTGDSRLATAGTGDVLAGVVGALCASGLDPWRAAGLGAFIHGLAGALGWRIGLVASDLLSTLPLVLQELADG